MSTDLPKILAVNPGSRYIGFAAFRGPDLLDWGVRVVTANTPPGRIRVTGKILNEAMNRFQPDILVTKRFHPSRSSPLLSRLAKSVKEASRRRKLAFHEYSITDLKSALWPEKTCNKRRLAEEVTAIYPVLGHDFRKETANRHPYYLRMFEAVALGIAYYRRSGR